MERINAFAVYQLGKWLDSVFLHARFPVKANPSAWVFARNALDYLIAPGPGRGEFTLNESVHLAMNLSMKLSAIIKRHQEDAETTLTADEAGELQLQITIFEQALALDLGHAPIYFVTPKGLYSTDRLLRLAEWAISPELRSAVSPSALRDLNQAGQCLAFGVATAAGYHALRAVEKVLREYYELATGLTTIPFRNGRPLEKSSMSDVINALRSSQKGDAKTLAIIDQIRELHRNPIDHPDLFLEGAEALEVFNICTGAISAMARQMTKLREKGPAATP